MVGSTSTTNVAGALVIGPTSSAMTTTYVPACINWTLVIVSVALVAAEMLAPLKRHWWRNGPTPFAVTENVTVLPAFVVILPGCCWMSGGKRILSWAMALTTEPALL